MIQVKHMKPRKSIVDLADYGNNQIAKAILKRDSLPWFHFYARFKANVNIREKRRILDEY